MKNKPYSYTIFKIYLGILCLSAFFLLLISFNSSSNKNEIPVYDSKLILENNEVKLCALDSYISDEDVYFIDRRNYDFDLFIDLDYTENRDILCVNVLSSYFSYTIYIEDEIIFERSVGKDDFIKSGASSYDIIRIANKYVGKTAKISFKSNISKNLEQNRPQIYIGSQGAIKASTFKGDFINLGFAAITFLIGIILSIIGVIYIYFDFKDNNFFSAGIFAILVSITTFIQTNTAYILIGNSSIIYFIEYISASSISLPIMNILSKKVSNKIKYVYKFIYLFMGLNILVQTILTFIGKSEFIVFRQFTLIITFIQLAVVFISTAFIYIKIFKNTKNKNKHFYISVMLLLISFAIMLVLYVSFPDYNFMIFVYLGVISFLGINLGIAIKRYVEDYKNFIYSNLIKDRALIDNLTKLGSRYAFDRNMKNISKKRKYKNMFFSLIDINSLKYINDYYGHHRGDMVIMSMSRLIKELIDKNKKAEGYRIGGDEFVFICYNISENQVNNILEMINFLANDYVENIDDCLSFAWGHELVNINDEFDINKVISVVDKKMYEDKNSNFH